MAETLTVYVKDFSPWTPAIDARRLAKPGIISGTNFLDDLDGVHSAFSSTFVNYNLFDTTTRAKVTELRLNDALLYGTPTGVWRINDTSGAAELILPITVTNTYWPWTIAYVGDVYYLAQYDIGLWQYDPENETMGHVDTPADDRIRYVNSSFGRLVYLTDTDVAVSALDDGTNLTPSLTTGAGAQALSLVGGVAYNIMTVPDGFLVYMSGGILRGLFTQAAYIFSYKRLTRAIKVFSPSACVYVPLLGVVSVDAGGFSVTNSADQEPVMWEPLQSDYAKNNIINALDKTLIGTMSLYHSLAENRIFFAFSDSLHEGFFQSTFVYTLVDQKWGSFDHPHYGIFETKNPVTNIFTCSYMADDGFMRVFTNTDFSYDTPESPFVMRDFVYRATLEEMPVMGAVDVNGVEYQIGYSEFNFSDNIPTAYDNYTTTGVFYMNYVPYSDTDNDANDDPEMDVSGSPIIGGTYMNLDTSGGIEIIAIPYTLPKISLASSVEIGPFRFVAQVQADETSAVSTIILGLTATSNFSITEDWNTLSGSEDWNALSGTEDWGSGNTVPNVFELTLSDTDDGVNAPLQGNETLEVFSNLGASLTYSPMGNSSVYHNLTLNTAEANQAFAVKFVDFTGLLTGRLMAV